jgi:simple sugar transport system substrate-binding protein
MKKLFALTLVLLMALSLLACTSSNPAQTSDATAASEQASASTEESASTAATEEKDAPVIAFVPKIIGQTWWDYVGTGVEEWADENGFEVKYQGPTDVDPAAQVQIMTDLVAQDIDILCFSPLDADSCENICKEAREKGIIVVATEASGMTNIDYDVEAFSEEGLGGFLMDQLAVQMDEEGEYITMVGTMTMESHNNWADAAVARQEARIRT